MRARLPDQKSFVNRDGVKIHFEVYGSGLRTLVFVPSWSIVHSRVYKAQVPFFAEHFRCVTFDPRGNGKSDRPDDIAAYSLDQHLADTIAVMDAVDAQEAVLIGASFGSLIVSLMAAHHSERVTAAVLIGTVATIGPGNPYMTPQHFSTPQQQYEGWSKYNRDYWLTN